MRRILFFVTEDWCFLSHRLALARAARAKGYEVYVVARIGKHREYIEQEGFKLCGITLQRRNKNMFREIRAFFELYKTISKIKPDIIHNIALKPVLYGTLLGRILRIPHIVNTFAGLGYVFTSNDQDKRILQRVLSYAFALLFYGKNITVIFQNPDDRDLFVRNRIVPHRKAMIIEGSGVDTGRFTYSPEPDGPPIVLFISRMLWDKGVSELVEAARGLKEDGVGCRVILVGDPDPENPSSIPKEVLRSWQAEGIIEWWGYRVDIPDIIAMSHIVVLPSYREGLPRVLLEAAACGRPLVAADVPGCREICRHGETGYLVRVKDPHSLQQAIQSLIDDPESRKAYGLRGRELVLREFSDDIILHKTLKVYDDRINMGTSPLE